MASGVDVHAIGGKFAAPREHARLLVIGGGEAGLAAAIAAARDRVSVVLVDENPVPVGLMGLDVPLFYGQRMNAAVQEEARMVERLVASQPLIEAAFDAGVDVRLGVTCWGLFVNGAAIGALSSPVAGLSDGASSWMCGFDAVILATGARDLVLGFSGVELPGVMGALGFASLLGRYDAFSGRRILILGSGQHAMATASLAQQRGIEVAGLVEVLPESALPASDLASMTQTGLEIWCGSTILRAEGNEDGVTGAILLRDGKEAHVACDTIVLAIGAVPSVELAATAGCALHYDSRFGGWVPVLDAASMTAIPGIFCAGDCTGLRAGDICAAATDVGRAASAYLAGAPTTHLAAQGGGTESEIYRLAWMRALMEAGQDGAMACMCEEVTRNELLGVKPPRYLGCTSNKIAARDSQTLLRDGPFNPDQIKRLTRAGMGPCQGRRCREQVALMLALESGAPVGSVPLASYRAPVRPLPLHVLADEAETPDMQAGWDVWFGIRKQWVPYDQIGTPAEDALLAAGGTSHA